ncbi:DUF3793 family protein [Desulfuribacillus stibiiarsenatis]|nr:DUF3793 family protein [Desulfuribacillus stibiiarsenatis]
MDKQLSKDFIDKREQLDDRNYLITTIAYHIAPTSAGKKPSNLLSFTSGGRNLHKLWKQYQYLFANDPFVSFFEIRTQPDSSLVLFYNPQMLQDILFQRKNMAFLKGYGYHEHMSTEDCLHQLKKHFDESCPHEIGIFLGIPLEDVCGFIKNAGQNCLLCGYWKVYHDAERAKHVFAAFDQAKATVLKELDEWL